MSIPLIVALKPIQKYLDNDKVNELMVNKPNEIIIETPQKKIIKEVGFFGLQELMALAGLIATYNNQRVRKEEPLLSGSLPGGQRVQVVLPPAVPNGMFGLAIRKPSTLDLTLEDYEKTGALASTVSTVDDSVLEIDKKLKRYIKENRMKDFLELAVLSKKNIIVSGGTSSGKTTFINALIKLIPLDERILTIQDVQEMDLKQKDILHLLHSKGGQGVSKLTVKELLEASLRLNPDRILVSELRGGEAFYYLRAINSGHPGSLTTLHANNIEGAFDSLTMMIKQGVSNLSDESIRTYLKSIIDVVIQFEKIKGKRIMTGYYFKGEHLK